MVYWAINGRNRPDTQTEPVLKSIISVADIVLNLMIWVLIIQAILSWLLAFNVVNARNQVVASIWRFTLAITEPLLKPIRRILPNFGGLDLSPLVLILLIYLIRDAMWRYLYPNVI
jgi:YggT family protein